MKKYTCKMNNPLLPENIKFVANVMTDKSTFIHQDGLLLHKTFLIERQPTTKLYKSTDNLTIFLNLSAQAIKTLFYIILKVESSTDIIKIKTKQYTELTNSSRTTLHRSLTELSEKKIIAKIPNTSNQYYINPTLFFSGNRLKKYPENVIIYKPSKKNKPNKAK